MKAVSKKAVAAVNRFGLGAKPGELEAVDDPRAWLNAQVTHGLAGAHTFSGLLSGLGYEREAARQHVVVHALGTDAREKLDFQFAGVPPDLARRLGKDKTALKELSRFHKQLGSRRAGRMLAEAAARYRVVITTDTPFLERLVHFWSNHFAISVERFKFITQPFAGPFEREAIRPHVTGRFIDMLLAVEAHPAMLIYLDNFRSMGLNSKIGQQVKKGTASKCETDGGRATGMNENLGREAMELHTVGVKAGYGQADVIEFSRALTGWSVPFPCDFVDGGKPKAAFRFRADAHEPGSRRVMGKTFRDGGFEQGKSILEFLARHPATAKHVSLKLARHFVSDDPPQSLVERMAKSYLAHDTDLAAVYRTMISSSEAWSAEARKFRTPQDFVNASLRAAQIDLGDQPQLALVLARRLGQPMFEPRSPAGFADRAPDWINGSALWKRIQAAEVLATRVAKKTPAPLELAQQALGPQLDDDTKRAIRAAGSRQHAYATLFACPAFQWRV